MRNDNQSQRDVDFHVRVDIHIVYFIEQCVIWAYGTSQGCSDGRGCPLLYCLSKQSIVCLLGLFLNYFKRNLILIKSTLLLILYWESVKYFIRNLQLRQSFKQLSVQVSHSIILALLCRYFNIYNTHYPKGKCILQLARRKCM